MNRVRVAVATALLIACTSRTASADPDPPSSLTPQQVCAKLPPAARAACEKEIDTGTFDPTALTACTRFQGTERRASCFRIVRDGHFMASALALCDSILFEIDSLNCLAAIRNESFSEAEVLKCADAGSSRKTISCIRDTVNTRSTQASKRLLVIAGLASETRYPAISKIASETFESLGYPTEFVVGKENAGTTSEWAFAASRLTEAKTAEDLREPLRAAVAKVPPGGTLTIFINNHGTDSSHPISFEGKSLTVVEFNSLLTNEIPRDRKVKIIGIQCFAGELHDIVFSHPNACAIAATSFDSVNYSTDEINLYGRGAFRLSESEDLALNEAQKPSLASLHFAGSVEDTLNEDRANLSSLAFVDRVLKKGQYSGVRVPYMLTPTVEEIQSGPFRAKTASRASPLAACRLDPLSQINPLSLREMDRVTSTVVASTLGFGSVRELPPELERIYRAVVLQDDLASGKVKSIETRIKDLQWEWDSLESEIAAARTAEHPNVEKLISLLERQDILRKSQAAELGAQYRVLDSLERRKQVSQVTRDRLSRVSEFMRVAREDEKQNFFRLLRCEMEPL